MEKIWFHKIKEGFLFYRYFIYIGNRKISFEIKLGDFSFNLNFNIGGEESEELQFSFVIPLIKIYLGFSGFLPKKIRDYFYNKKLYNGLSTGISIHHWIIWWIFFMDQDVWDNKEPKWRRGNFDIPQFFLGKEKYWKNIIEKKEIEFTVPEHKRGDIVYSEKKHKGMVTRYKGNWKRKRWFTKSLNRIEIDLINSIPHPGKGTADYNCEEDALFGCSIVGDKTSDIVNYVIKQTNYYRDNYPL